MTDQSETEKPAIGLNTDTVELTIKTLLSHLITREVHSPVHSLRMAYGRLDEPYSPPVSSTKRNAQLHGSHT
eukprot:3549611-Pyramimonas_sp.AAC.2